MTPKAKASNTKSAAKPKPPRGQREHILEVAERLCGERGIEAVSVRDIAAEAQVNLSAINYYFGTRQKLMLAIFNARVEEVRREREELLEPLLKQPKPALRAILRAMLTPLARWRVPTSERRPALQFLCRALTAADPDIRQEISVGVKGFRDVIAALQRALPHLSYEDLCWRFHFMMSIEHMNPWDVERLHMLSDGICHAGEFEEALQRAIDFAEAGFLAPARTTAHSHQVK